jgi:nucleoside-diphosphate-sugar epimerase
MPSGIYEASKVQSEDLVRAAVFRGAFEYVILRPSNVYGAEMANQSLFGLISMIQRGLFFYIGEKGSKANYIHVDNVVKALFLCGTSPDAKGQTFNLSDSCSIEQFIMIITDVLGVSKRQIRLPEFPMRMVAKVLGIIPGFPLTEARVDALTNQSIYLNDKIEYVLNYRHVISMEEGLSEIVKFWQLRSK